MHRIRKNGKYQIMVNAHQMHKETHRGSAFFFYHTYFVWEVETQIRALGGKFKCFALPMYDWTIDVGREQNPWILNTVLGGDGDPNNLLCVSQPNDADSAWSQPEWNVRELCNKNLENSHVGCCLKRQLWEEGDLGDAATMGEVMERDTFKPMSGGVAFYHQKVHWLLVVVMSVKIVQWPLDTLPMTLFSWCCIPLLRICVPFGHRVTDMIIYR